MKRIILYTLLFINLHTNAQTLLDSTFKALFEYRHVGPMRGGRVTAVCGIASQPSVFFMGASGGGLWKTTDYGINWSNVSDGYFASPSIGDIQVSASNSNVVYVGTGSDGIRSNVIAGKGVYKSTNQGNSWEHVGLEKTGHIGAVEIHPNNEDVVFVAAIGQAFNANKERGIFRTQNGGKSWEQVYFHSDTVGAVDIEFHPENPDIIYASLWRVERKPWTIISGGHQAGGIIKSTDGGTTWKKLDQGLPKGLIGKIDLAVSAANPNRLYALVEAPIHTKEGGLYRSDDQGESFKMVSNKKELLDRPFYYCNIEADPNNADIIYALATRYYKSTDGGFSWKSQRVPHSDSHDLWINPHNSLLQIQCNDGGANVTLNGGKSWSSQNNQPTAEIYQVELDDQFPFWIYGGQQDNSTIAVPSLPPYRAIGGNTSYWLSVGGCETGPAVPKPGNHNIVYSNCKGRFGVFDKRTGQEQRFYVGATNMYGHNPKNLKYRFQRVAPIHVSPHNPNHIYHCSQYVHLSKNEGKSWETISPDLCAFDSDKQVISGSPITRDITGEEYYSTIYSIRESSIKPGLIWVGTNDGLIQLTKDGGKNWLNVTPKMPPGGRVDAIAPSPHEVSKAYASILRYQLGDWKPYIYKTNDWGESWTLITNGIPKDCPVRVVREHPVYEGLLFAGTEFGLFVSLNDGLTWQKFQLNLPVTPVSDLKIRDNQLVISTIGRGFWILDNLNLLHEYQNQLEEVHFFKPHDTFRLQSIRTSNGIKYSAPGIDFIYFTHQGLQNTIQLLIKNEQNEIIRTFKSKTIPLPQQNAIDDMQTGFFTPSDKSPALKCSAGFHKIKWNLRHNGVWDKAMPQGENHGALVKPGKYTAILKYNNREYAQTFSVLIDPRLEQSNICFHDLVEQEKLALQIRDLHSSAKKLHYQIATRLNEIESLRNKNKKKLLKEKDGLNELLSKLQAKREPYAKPMLIAQISYLSAMINQADQLPGDDAYSRYEELQKEFAAIESNYNKIK